MLDVGIGAGLLFGWTRAIRGRHWLAVALFSAAAYLLLMDATSALSGPSHARPAYEFFIALFLGPTALFDRGPGPLPTSSLFVARPWLVRWLIAGLALLVVAVLRRTSAPLRPESTRARSLDATTLPAMFVAVAEGMVLIMYGLTAILMR